MCTSPILVVALSKAWVWGRSLPGIVGSNPAGARLFVSCDFCVLSCRGVCVGLITRTEESCQVWCAEWVWSWSPLWEGSDPPDRQNKENKKRLLLLLLLQTAIELSLGGSSLYTSTNKQVRINIHKRNNTNNTKQSIYKYTYYQNTHTFQTSHIHTPTLYKTS